MPIDVHSLLTPAVTRQWEFSLSEPGYEVRYDRVVVCDGCGKAHQKVFLETEWDEDESDYPDRAVVLTVLQGDEEPIILVDHFEQGERQVRAVFRVEDLREFLSKATEEVAESLRVLRRVSLQKTTPQSEEDRAVACLN